MKSIFTATIVTLSICSAHASPALGADPRFNVHTPVSAAKPQAATSPAGAGQSLQMRYGSGDQKQSGRSEVTSKNSKSVFFGPGSTGGGDPTSQEIIEVLQSLPNSIQKIGAANFPEINLVDLSRTIFESKIRVELATNIYVNGAPKAACFDREANKISIDAQKWAEISFQDDAGAKRQSLLLHEVLGLMGLEENNDYHISGRFLAMSALSSSGTVISENQISSTDVMNPEVIYWTTSTDQKNTLYYCKDRRDIKTCRQIGNKSFSKKELASQFSKFKNTRNLKIGAHIGIAGTALVATILTGGVAPFLVTVLGGVFGPVFYIPDLEVSRSLEAATTGKPIATRNSLIGVANTLNSILMAD